jgi:hypothetical protein
VQMQVTCVAWIFSVLEYTESPVATTEIKLPHHDMVSKLTSQKSQIKQLQAIGKFEFDQRPIQSRIDPKYKRRKIASHTAAKLLFNMLGRLENSRRIFNATKTIKKFIYLFLTNLTMKIIITMKHKPTTIANGSK